MKPSGALLRPLNIGEIFDRSITLYLKNFVTITLIVLTVVAPYGIATFVFGPDQTTQIQQLIDTVAHPTKQQAKAADPFADYTPAKAVGLGLSVLLFLLFAPFASNAVAVAVAAVYQGRSPEYGASYAAAFKRWGPIIGTGTLVGLIFIGGYILFSILFVLLIIAAAALVQNALPAAIVLFIIAGLAFLVFLMAIVVLFLVSTFALYSVVIEHAGPGTAISRAFNRLLSRGEFWKAFLMALAALAFQFGVSSITGTLALALLFVTHSNLPTIVVSSLTNAVVTGFIAVLLAVYYYDVRVRREGLDMEIELTQLTHA